MGCELQGGNVLVFKGGLGISTLTLARSGQGSHGSVPLRHDYPGTLLPWFLLQNKLALLSQRIVQCIERFRV